MNSKLIVVLSFLASFRLLESKKGFVKFDHSFGHKNFSLHKWKNLNSTKSITLTLVTGSTENTQQVASYYQTIQGLSVFNQTDMHVKLKGSVQIISQEFNTTFSEYNCENNTERRRKKTCDASNSEVSVPASIRSAIIGILGLEQVLTVKPNYHKNQTPLNKTSTGDFKPKASYPYFIGSQAAQVYGFPISDGSGVRIGIITLGGYFNQSDLDNYFNKFNLGTAPSINIVYVDGATMDFVDPNDESGENYLDVEIIASIVPKASITLYFAPNTFAGFYDAISLALQQNDVVSLSWGTSESGLSSYWSSFESLLSTNSKVSIFIATGDAGSSGGVGFPASCPSAIGKNEINAETKKSSLFFDSFNLSSYDLSITLLNFNFLIKLNSKSYFKNKVAVAQR